MTECRAAGCDHDATTHVLAAVPVGPVILKLKIPLCTCCLELIEGQWSPGVATMTGPTSMTYLDPAVVAELEKRDRG